MSTKADYSQNEWETLRDTPIFTALAMVMASPNGLIGAAQESAALAKSMAEAARHANPLLAALSQRSEGGNEELKKYMQETAAQKKGAELPQFLEDNALMMCRLAASILAAKATPDEAATYKSWVLQQATAVAQAAKEGGQTISANEAEFLGEIGQALTK
jgi:hypothetical protein